MLVRVNEPNVVYEAFDEEVVVVNLDTGNYYSVRGSGPQVWMALARGATIEALAETVAAASGKDRAGVEAELRAFVAALIEAELVLETEGSSTPTSWEGGFEAPLLETYSDMQDLLMLDPIHDVDTGGWPLAKEA